jgi:hypothetical protein|tara:strand:- start:379 stop:1050 length:672 start_codon:yes stop_codon:yes gene_type:complete
MDNLRNIMQCLDDISKLIPEGTYLEMCDNLKQVHDNIPKNNDPPVTDSRRAPFQVVQRGVDESESESESESDDEPWNPEWYDEWTQNEEFLRRLLADLKVAKTMIRTSKPIQRMTKKAREAAMRHFTAFTPIFDINIFEETDSSEATFENYVRLTEWAYLSRVDRKELTSKKFEKKIYEDYKMLENHRIETRKSEAMELKRNLEIEIYDIRQRQDYLRVHYNL